jgi:sugar-specific transcriptional regulator TrmB
MPNYVALLKAIGLNESEADVYLTALEFGPAPAQVLVKKSGFSRPATYQAIDLLVQKGLLSTTLKGKRHQYVAEPPERVLHFGETQVNRLQTKVADVARALPDLSLLQHGERPNVRLFDGVDGLRAILQDLVASKPKETLELADMESVRAFLSPEELQEAQDILSKSKAKGRALLVGEVRRVRAGIEARLLPKGEFVFNGDLLIYGNKVAMVTYKGKIMGVVIESDVLVEMYRAFFELAWKGAKDYPAPKV